MPNQRKQSAKRVPKGTAPEDFCPQMSMLSAKKMLKQMPAHEKAKGNRNHAYEGRSCGS